MHQWFIPLSILSGSIIIAFLFEIIFLGWLRRISKKNPWEGSALLIKSLHGYTALVIIIIGAWFAVLDAPLSQMSLFYARKVLKISAVLAGTVILARVGVNLVRFNTRSIAHSVLATSILVTITRIVIFSIGLLIVLQLFGISITPMLTALGVGGLAVALAMQDTLSNLFAGFHVIISRNIRPGDYIKLNTGEEGIVSDINWRNTIIKAPANNIIIVPNSKISTSIITNFTLPADEVIFTVPVSVAYTSDLAKIELVTIEVALQTMKEERGGVPGFQPLVRYNAFSESGISFNVILRSQNYDSQFAVKHGFIKRLHQRYSEEKIEVGLPARIIFTKSPDTNPAL